MPRESIGNRIGYVRVFYTPVLDTRTSRVGIAVVLQTILYAEFYYVRCGCLNSGLELGITHDPFFSQLNRIQIKVMDMVPLLVAFLFIANRFKRKISNVIWFKKDVFRKEIKKTWLQSSLLGILE